MFRRYGGAAVIPEPNYIIDKAFRPDNGVQTLFSGSFALILEEPRSGRTCLGSRLWGGNSRSGATDVARPGGWVRRARGGVGGWGGVTLVRFAVLMGLWKQVGMFWARNFGVSLTQRRKGAETALMALVRRASNWTLNSSRARRDFTVCKQLGKHERAE